MKLACGGRMPESAELCIQISTPTTPRHHRDEELPMPNIRICRIVCTDQPLVNSSNIDSLRIYKTVDTNRPTGTVAKNAGVRQSVILKGSQPSESRTRENEVQNLLNCRHRSTRWSESVKLWPNYHGSENALLRPPKMTDVNRLFAKIAHRHQKV